MHPIVQPLGVQGADPAIGGDDHVEEAIVDVGVGVAGYRHVGQVGGAGRPVLHLQGGPGIVVAEGNPSDRAGFGSLVAAVALPGPTDLLRHVAHGGVVGAVDGIPDQGGLGRGGSKLGC